MACLNTIAICVKGTHDDIHSWYALHVWAVSASFALVSTRYLLVDENWHYPCHLLLLQLLAAAIIRALIDLNSCKGSKTKVSRSSFKSFGRGCLAGATSVLSIQAVLHVPNTATLAMLPLHVLLGHFMVSLIQHWRKTPWTEVSRVAIVLACSAIIHLCDYRATLVGTILTHSLVILATVSRHLSPAKYGHEQRFSWKSFYMCGIAITMISKIWLRESSSAAIGKLSKDMTLTLLSNVSVAALAFNSGRALLAPLRLPEGKMGTMSPMNPTGAVQIEIVYILYFVCWVGVRGARWSFISSPQFISFFTALLSINGARLPKFGAPPGYDIGWAECVQIVSQPDSDQRAALGTVVNKVEHDMPIASEGTLRIFDDTLALELEINGHQKNLRLEPIPTQSRSARETIDNFHRRSIEMLNRHEMVSKSIKQQNRASINQAYIPGICALLMITATVSIVLCFLLFNFIWQPKNFTSPLPQHLDRLYTPSRSIEIVVSTYKESHNDLHQLLRHLKAIPTLNESKVQLYTKNPFVEPEYLRLATGADEVLHLPNIGREGHTYLHHITSKWNDLAAHTLFLRGNLNHEDEVLERIKSYFAPNRTGFLDLGPLVGNVCSCATCGDRFGWTDPIGVQHIHNDLCPKTPCTNILLTYKGQFIVSAKRIRGIRKSWWQELKGDLEDKMSWLHRLDDVRGQKNSLNNPLFGFTLERMWGVLMQCNDMDVAWKCLTAFSGRRFGGDHGDCQCFDE